MACWVLHWMSAHVCQTLGQVRTQDAVSPEQGELHSSPGIVPGGCPGCAVSHWVSPGHVPGLVLAGRLVSDEPSVRQTLCLLSSQDVSSPHPGWVSIHCASGSVTAAADKKQLKP